MFGASMLQAFYRDRKVDLSPLHIWKDDPGVMDYVVIAGLVRSPMGRFQTLFSSIPMRIDGGNTCESVYCILWAGLRDL